MKHSKACVPKESNRPSLSLSTFVRVAALLTLGALITMLAILLLSGDQELWQYSGFLRRCDDRGDLDNHDQAFGCLVMIPVGISRTSRQLARKHAPASCFPRASLG